MMVQGQRLKEVVQQLQAALRPFPDQEHEQGSSAAAIGARTPLNLPRLPQQPAMRVEAAEWKDRSGVRPARWMPGATPRCCLGAAPAYSPQERGSVALPATGVLEEESCNAIAVLLELVAGASGVCDATGVRLKLGPGLQVTRPWMAVLHGMARGVDRLLLRREWSRAARGRNRTRFRHRSLLSRPCDP